MFLGDDIATDKVVKWLEECIPCTDRWKALGDLRPWDDFMALVQQDLLNRLGILDDIAALFNNTEIVDDFCAIAQYLNALCIPDLAAILALLQLLLAKLADLTDFQLSDLVWGLLSGLMSPFLSGFRNLLNQYVDIIFSPIECILDSLTYQMQKIPGSEGAIQDMTNFRNRQLQRTKDATKDFVYGEQQDSNALTDARNRISEERRKGKSYLDAIQGAGSNPPDYYNNVLQDFSVLGAVELVPQYLFYYVAMGEQMVVDLIGVIENSIREIFGQDTDLMKSLLTISQNLKRIRRLIGIVEAMVRLAKGGVICPGVDYEQREIVGEAERGGIGSIPADELADTYNYSIGDTFRIEHRYDPDTGDVGFYLNPVERIDDVKSEWSPSAYKVPENLVPQPKNLRVDTCAKNVTMEDNKALREWMRDITRGE
jgi:hypothetical protein